MTSSTNHHQHQQDTAEEFPQQLNATPQPPPKTSRNGRTTMAGSNGRKSTELPVSEVTTGVMLTNYACVECRKSHKSCSKTRPCVRCVKLGIQDKCVDIPRKLRGRPREGVPDGEPDPYTTAVGGGTLSRSPSLASSSSTSSDSSTSSSSKRARAAKRATRSKRNYWAGHVSMKDVMAAIDHKKAHGNAGEDHDDNNDNGEDDNEDDDDDDDEDDDDDDYRDESRDYEYNENRVRRLPKKSKRRTADMRSSPPIQAHAQQQQQQYTYQQVPYLQPRSYTPHHHQHHQQPSQLMSFHHYHTSRHAIPQQALPLPSRNFVQEQQHKTLESTRWHQPKECRTMAVPQTSPSPLHQVSMSPYPCFSPMSTTSSSAGIDRGISPQLIMTSSTASAPTPTQSPQGFEVSSSPYPQGGGGGRSLLPGIESMFRQEAHNSAFPHYGQHQHQHQHHYPMPMPISMPTPIIPHYSHSRHASGYLFSPITNSGSGIPNKNSSSNNSGGGTGSSNGNGHNRDLSNRVR